MKKLLVVMWIAIILLVGVTVWLLFNPAALLHKLAFVPKSELEKARAEADAKTQALILQSQTESDRKIAQVEQQRQQREILAARFADEKRQVEKKWYWNEVRRMSFEIKCKYS